MAYARMVCSISASRISPCAADGADKPVAKSAACSKTTIPTARFATIDKTFERISEREKYALRTGSAINRIMPLKIRYGFRLRQSIGGVLAAAILAGCSFDAPPEGQIGHVEGNFGGVVSGEPRASLIGRDVLSAGGSAVDAAVAMYFAL
ncbi:MAG: hypothetical protein VW547_17880, partial [Alphaproteobacteria bacterium]